MAQFQMISIPGFDNPVLQRPGGSEWPKPGQRVKVPLDGINAIMIAADSHVDVVDFWLEGDVGNLDKRIRVSVEAPFIGHIPSGHDLVVTPVRAFLSTAAITTLVENIGPAEFPRCKLAIYSGCFPSLPTQRAPLKEDFAGTTTVANQNVTVYVPTAGRTLVSLNVEARNGAGGWTQCTYYVYGIDCSAVAVTGVVEDWLQQLATGVLNVAVPEASFEYQGAPYDVMGVLLDPDAGTYDYRVTFSAYDR